MHCQSADSRQTSTQGESIESNSCDIQFVKVILSKTANVNGRAPRRRLSAAIDHSVRTRCSLHSFAIFSLVGTGMCTIQCACKCAMYGGTCCSGTYEFEDLVGRQASRICHRPGEVEYTVKGGRLVLVVRDHVEKSESYDLARATSVERRRLGHTIQGASTTYRKVRK